MAPLPERISAKASVKTRPSDGDGFQPANNNAANYKAANDNGTLSEEAKLNIAGPIEESLNNPTKIRPADGGPNLTAANDNEVINEGAAQSEETYDPRPQYQSENPEINEEDDAAIRRKNYIQEVREGFNEKKIYLSDEEILDLINTNFKVNFPVIAFSICFIEELGEFFLKIISLIFIVVLFPIGIAGGVFSFFTSFTGIIGFLIWSNFYAKNASDFTRKIPFAKRMIFQFFFKKSWMLVFSFIAVPMKTFRVILNYMYVKGLVKFAEEVYLAARSKSGY